jgi:hypothetical protein
MFKFLTDTPQKKTALYFMGAVFVLAIVAVHGQQQRCATIAANQGYYISAGNKTLRGRLADLAMSCDARDFEFYQPPTSVTNGLYTNPGLQLGGRR